ncbi:protein GVQW3-like isoform X3 [Saimiri boliviensis]|uniref:protein GVQW3-like isoform X3 n=1 Tax=Saimiri boliviensis TaxID=27679 RepID=UPI003D7880D2
MPDAANFEAGNSIDLPQIMEEEESPYAAQAGLELLTSSDPPALASQNAGIIGSGVHEQNMEDHCIGPEVVPHGSFW